MARKTFDTLTRPELKEFLTRMAPLCFLKTTSVGTSILIVQTCEWYHSLKTEQRKRLDDDLEQCYDQWEALDIPFPTNPDCLMCLARSHL